MTHTQTRYYQTALSKTDPEGMFLRQHSNPAYIHPAPLITYPSCTDATSVDTGHHPPQLPPLSRLLPASVPTAAVPPSITPTPTPPQLPLDSPQLYSSETGAPVQRLAQSNYPCPPASPPMTSSVVSTERRCYHDNDTQQLSNDGVTSLPSPASPADGNRRVYAFVSLSGPTQRKRPRRKFHEIDRFYPCSFPGCSKSYGTLNHLNAHISMQKHGPRRLPSEFRDIRKQRRKQKQYLAALQKAQRLQQQQQQYDSTSTESTDGVTLKRTDTHNEVATSAYHDRNTPPMSSPDLAMASQPH